MKRLITLISLMTVFSLPASANPSNLDELLAQVKKEQGTKAELQIQREEDFLSKRDQQMALLKEAQSQLAAIEKVTMGLTRQFEKNEKDLAGIETQKQIVLGTLGEMFGVVKQVAGDMRGQFEGSVISAQIPGRKEAMADLAERKSLPEIQDLENLWFHLQQEMTESGKVTRFKASVIAPDGTKNVQPVVRVGSFNLISDGLYLHFQPATGQIMELARQPEGKHLSLASDFASSRSSFAAFSLDPSRGSLLSMLVQAPSLGERFQQGGVVGYVIIALLILGLILVIERLIVLYREGKKITSQLASTEANLNNPLGRIMQVFSQYREKDLETLELKIDEEVLRSTPKLERGIGTIKLLSAVAPLLGLLGTVTGMILTFQSITLFGTSDPKLMAGGISQALITTVFGLVCAIPLLLLHNFVNSKSKGLIQILEEQSAGMIASRGEKG
ncbi:MAG: MotA/TolQ/ExbB proton channel family protein [Bdellovibrionaceae bacterium]|nr:MotA/TolQ/ExbB proton channel family protein [Bdellovibrionales bacterium]MCB9083296.1 MotA/TolQ/ExbB proton channel family protein [Pseudobdellovibrionaceae bacterium]